jgi:hypothetical protein
MFKHCKIGGDNLEKSHANNQRLNSFILLMIIAYSYAILQGKHQEYGNSKYVGRLTEYGRSIRPHSSFWIGLLASMLGAAKRRELEWNLSARLLLN